MTANAPLNFPTLAQREALRERPDSAAVMIQSWQKLLFLHWKIETDLLEPHLPAGLSVDTFDGAAWIGVVPFFMRNVRPRFLPAVPGISNFLELNVRTYVFDRDGIPGVWFFSLDANSRLACTLGRSLFKLAYRDAEMGAEENSGWIRYTTRRQAETEVATFDYRGTGPRRTAEPGSLEFFLVERYLLYSHRPDSGRLYRGRVHHTPYEFQDAEYREHSSLPAQWNGIAIPEAPPDHALFANSVDVRIFAIESCPSE